MTRDELVAKLVELRDLDSLTVIMAWIDEYADGCCASCDGHSCDDPAY